MTAAGIAHFTHSRLFESLVPDALGEHRREVNLATGVFQTAGGLSFFVPRLRLVARWSTVALLVPTYPEAVNQVRHPERIAELGIPARLAFVRIPAQTIMLALVWRATRAVD
jgi:uncharacterized membrane protein